MSKLPKAGKRPCPLHPDDQGSPSYRKRCAECKRIHERAYRITHEQTITNRYSNARSQANRRGLEFTITLQEYEHLLSQPCVYSYNGPNHKIGQIGLDRINSSKGYISGNVQPCCGHHNNVKGDWFTHDQMLEIVQRYQIPCGHTGGGRKRIGTV